MANILNVLADIFYRPYKRPLLIVALVVLLALLSYFIYIYVVRPRTKNAPLSDIPNANRRDQTVTIFFFYANWCPHCKKAKPEWDAFVAKYDGVVVNNQKVRCMAMDCTDGENADVKIVQAMQRYHVEHFPTTILVSDATDGKPIEYEGKITVANLTQYVETITATAN